jgi:hypothetical protein
MQLWVHHIRRISWRRNLQVMTVVRMLSGWSLGVIISALGPAVASTSGADSRIFLLSTPTPDP